MHQTTSPQKKTSDNQPPPQPIRQLTWILATTLSTVTATLECIARTLTGKQRTTQDTHTQHDQSAYTPAAMDTPDQSRHPYTRQRYISRNKKITSLVHAMMTIRALNFHVPQVNAMDQTQTPPLQYPRARGTPRIQGTPGPPTPFATPRKQHTYHPEEDEEETNTTQIRRDGLTDYATMVDEEETDDDDNQEETTYAQEDDGPEHVLPVSLKPPGGRRKHNKHAIASLKEAFIGHWKSHGTTQIDPLQTGHLRTLAGNCGGRLTPWGTSGHTIKNRLDAAMQIIIHGVADMILLSEGHITQDVAKMIEEHARFHGGYKPLIAPTSQLTADALGEYGDPRKKDPAAGVAALLSPKLAERVRGPAEKLASGRILHFTIGDGATPSEDVCPTHVIVVYGVSGESCTSGARASWHKACTTN
jgi:hypothetical protein